MARRNRLTVYLTDAAQARLAELAERHGQPAGTLGSIIITQAIFPDDAVLNTPSGWHPAPPGQVFGVPAHHPAPPVNSGCTAHDGITVASAHHRAPGTRVALSSLLSSSSLVLDKSEREKKNPEYVREKGVAELQQARDEASSDFERSILSMAINGAYMSTKQMEKLEEILSAWRLANRPTVAPNTPPVKSPPPAPPSIKSATDCRRVLLAARGAADWKPGDPRPPGVAPGILADPPPRAALHKFADYLWDQCRPRIVSLNGERFLEPGDRGYELDERQTGILAALEWLGGI